MSEVKDDSSSEPVLAPELEQPRKQSKAAQLAEARAAKKRKTEKKEEEDRAVRAALLKLTEQNEKLRAEKKQDKLGQKMPTPARGMPPEPTACPEEEPPVVVRRKRKREEGEELEEEEEEAGPSFKTEAAKVGLLAVLGLVSWYIQNKAFATQKKKEQIPNQEEKEDRKGKEKEPVHSIFPGIKRAVSKGGLVGNSGFRI